MAHGNANEHHGLEFGQTMVKWFRKSKYSSFYDRFSKRMVTIIICGKMLYDQEMIYEIMIVLSSNRSVGLPIDMCMLTDIVYQ